MVQAVVGAPKEKAEASLIKQTAAKTRRVTKQEFIIDVLTATAAVLRQVAGKLYGVKTGYIAMNRDSEIGQFVCMHDY